MTTTVKTITQVIKRDGRVVDFDPYRIKSAVARAMHSIDPEVEDTDTASSEVAQEVVNTLVTRDLVFPHIEQVQDIVEETLILHDLPQTAKHYILYRNERAREREAARKVPEIVEELVQDSSNYFENLLSEFVYYRTYSRWIPEQGRRETWIESVYRYMNYMKSKLGDKLSAEEYAEVQQYIMEMKAMPSMRLMWSAGAAADFDNACAYNCSYIAITMLKDFSEVLYLLMCGCGVGFSVEAHHIQQLPIVSRQLEDVDKREWVIDDSKAGWADALYYGMVEWFRGGDMIFDYSRLRPSGARLHTMGGRSSGPEPLRELLEFTRRIILASQGKRLSALNVHDIICKTGECVVAGGVRRSSLISLSDLDDKEMRDAKQGHFFLQHNHRQLANNSVAYKDKPTATEFMREWLSLAESGSGERGIFNRGSLPQQIPSRRLKALNGSMESVGTNPCGEIFLKSKQFCNLTEVVAREDDTLATLKKKVRIAAILGTYQSTLTNFTYLTGQWKENCDQERLLGVSITGQWDSPEARKVDVQRWAKAIAVDTNIEFAKRFGINESTCVTCTKPSGTVSQLVNAASGTHPRYAKHYIRRVRISATDPLFRMMKDQGVPYHPEVGQSPESAVTYVLEFPVKAPDNAVTRHDITAIQQLEYWKTVKENYTEHNPSTTIYVGDDEWFDVGHWVYSNWDIIGGLAFLPRDNAVYRLSPFEEISAERYQELLSEFPPINFGELLFYEDDDNTSGAKTYACVGDSCEV
jgi:ribonucleoside-triphosphate reductase